MSYLNLFLAESNENFKIVQVQFPSSQKIYHYKTILDIQKDDYVVVDAPGGFEVLQVLDTIPGIETDLTYNFQLKWIVSRVDVETYQECIKMEREATKVLNQLKYTKRRKALLSELEETIGTDGVEHVKKLVRL